MRLAVVGADGAAALAEVGARKGRGETRVTERQAEEWVPLSVWEARRARAGRDDLWPYVWMNFVSMILLFAAAVIMAYRTGAQSCH